MRTASEWIEILNFKTGALNARCLCGIQLRAGSEILAHDGVLGGHDICDNTARSVSAKTNAAALKFKISAKAADKKLQRAEIRAKFKKREIKFEKHKIKFKKREVKFEILKAQS